MRAWVALLVAAYVMPAYSVLKRMASERDDLALVALRVDGTATVPTAAAPEVANALGITSGPGELQLSMAVSMRFPGRCRVELGSLDSTKSVAAVSNNGKRRVEGTELQALAIAVDEICAILALRGSAEGDSRAAVEKHLAALKIDARQASLGRFVRNLVYVVGVPGAGQPGLWVYKDDKFHPARVRFTDDKGAVWNVDFIDYTSQATGDFFPRLVEVWKGDALQLRLTTLNADPKVKLDDKLF